MGREHRDAVLAQYYKDNSQVATQPPPDAVRAFKDADLNGKSSVTTRTSANYGIRPQQRKMSMTRMVIVGPNARFGSNASDELVCHYNPETVVKTVGSNYFSAVGVAGVRTERYQFKEGKANVWTMNLLFSTWGDEFRNRSDGLLNVDESLKWIEETVRPSATNGVNSHAQRVGNKLEYMEGPAPVFVNLFNSSFVAYIKDAQITYQKISPLSGVPIRAEVSLSFIEYVTSTL